MKDRIFKSLLWNFLKHPFCGIFFIFFICFFYPSHSFGAASSSTSKSVEKVSKKFEYNSDGLIALSQMINDFINDEVRITSADDDEFARLYHEIKETGLRFFREFRLKGSDARFFFQEMVQMSILGVLSTVAIVGVFLLGGVVVRFFQYRSLGKNRTALRKSSGRFLKNSENIRNESITNNRCFVEMGSIENLLLIFNTSEEELQTESKGEVRGRKAFFHINVSELLHFLVFFSLKKSDSFVEDLRPLMNEPVSIFENRSYSSNIRGCLRLLIETIRRISLKVGLKDLDPTLYVNEELQKQGIRISY